MSFWKRARDRLWPFGGREDESAGPDYAILTVCAANICRSPLAQGIISHELALAGLGPRVMVDSAGTHDGMAGGKPDARSQRVANDLGIDLSGYKARQIQPDDFERFNLILVMDDDNYEHLISVAPPETGEKVRLILSFSPDAAIREVPDPYYGNAAGFDEVCRLLLEAAPGVVAHVRERLTVSGSAS